MATKGRLSLTWMSLKNSHQSVMHSERNLLFIQKLFIYFACIGLFFNIVLDIKAFSENTISDQLGNKVYEAAEASIILEYLDHGLNQKPSIEKEIDVRKKFLRLREFKIKALQNPVLDSIEKNILQLPDQQRPLIMELQEALAQETFKRVNTDREQNAVVSKQMLIASQMDIVLITAMLILFIINIYLKRKTEKNLKFSLDRMRHTLQTLEEEAVKRNISTKTIIHDLKNPFGSIMGFAQLLTEDSSSKMMVLKFSDRIRQISERSLILVESLLHSSETNLPMEKINLVQLTTNIITQLSVQASKKQQRIIYKEQTASPWIKGNALKLEELIANLLSNAIKYSPFKSEIAVNLSCVENTLQLSIKDEGPGFSAEDKIHAFQFGQKLSARPTDGESSTGFGLYIAKQIVDLHYGKIEILDELKGAKLVVTLPSWT